MITDTIQPTRRCGWRAISGAVDRDASREAINARGERASPVGSTRAQGHRRILGRLARFAFDLSASTAMPSYIAKSRRERNAVLNKRSAEEVLTTTNYS